MNESKNTCTNEFLTGALARMRRQRDKASSDVTCESCNTLMKDTYSKCHNSRYDCKNLVCESCPKVKLVTTTVTNLKFKIHFIQLCKICTDKLIIYNCAICETYIDNYHSPITCSICKKHICFRCANILKCSYSPLSVHHSHKICDDCNISSYARNCYQSYNRHYIHHHLSFKPIIIPRLDSIQLKDMHNTRLRLLPDEIYKYVCSYLIPYHKPMPYRFCKICKKVMCSFKTDNICSSSCRSRKFIVSTCQCCHFPYKLINMHANRTNCCCCNKILTIHLCQSHQDCKSVIKWKCCSICDDYYCKYCAYKQNVHVCKKCARVFCNRHTNIIKNKICKYCI